MALEPTRIKKAPRSWDALTPPLAQWILDYLSSSGFEHPTPVQKSCLEIFRGNKDVVVEAVTGSGKTLAFLIPTVEKLLKGDEPAKRHHVQAIIISPTRELASQIYNVLLTLIKFHAPSEELLLHIKSDEKRPATTQPVIVPQLLVGGTTKAAEDLSTFLRLSPNILVGTPGRLAELLSSPYVKAPTGSFECLVMDEADRLLDLGFSQELTRILGYLPKQRRTGLFSASLSEAVEKLILVGMLYPHKITVRVRSLKDGGVIEERKTPMSLQLSYIVTPTSKKMPALCELLEKLEPRPQRAIVFFSTCFAVKYFSRVLPGILPAGFSVASLHGKLEPQVREKNFERFVNATSPTILLTTDIAARGLDIPQVDLVVQHDPPPTPKSSSTAAGAPAAPAVAPGREEGYVELLAVRKTPITPLDKPLISVSDARADWAAANFRAQALADREIFMLAQRAFVSWTRSYIEHQASSIFRMADLDFLDLAKGWGLLELPKMPELKGKDIDRSLGLGVDTEAIPFREKLREKKRQVELAEWKAEKAARIAAERAEGGAGGIEGVEKKRRKNEAWSAKLDQEDLKVARREKKRVKREATRFSEMTEDEKKEHLKLKELLVQVRDQVKTKEKEDDEDFEGFAD
ncbi:P-loop containing nucleoside triphosphate hydrolase protein [Cercophora scortea]|uniref:ATP-dependent RNA helicase n=1 Tax=Cercophora scortea TaxID=314031 RepID=A0AAE0I9T3_9PEZI|nr:P-loop containing nucleoside triphosphate hydrolase protein [Cercophora scortea]